jgi:hypothetical protein
LFFFFFVSNLYRALKGETVEGFEDVQSLTKTYHWLFTDIIGGANPTIPTNDQVRKIAVLNELMARTETFRNRDPASTVILPVGDGVAVGFGDSAEKPLRLAIELHKALFRYNESKTHKDGLSIRIGIDMGPVYFVKDLNGKDNVWGPGIMLTRSVMDMCGDMQIYAASRIAEDLVQRSSRYKDLLHHVKDYETKYGEKIQLYNVYGKDFGTKKSTAKTKKSKTNPLRTIKSGINFVFNEIQVTLDILDKKTMQTHHVWIWDVVNISKQPKSKIFYYLEGQVPKDFVRLDIKVTGENNNILEISDIVDKPYRKEFNVILPQPVMPKQKTRIRLEYDWEEPDRVFSYEFLSRTKKFSYTCTLPKDIGLKNRILKVDAGTGYHIHASPPATIIHHDDKTVITWKKTNIIPPDLYQFYW